VGYAGLGWLEHPASDLG
jgi:hypothetical protein